MTVERTQISYEEVLKLGLDLIKTYTDLIWEGSEKSRADTAIMISAIIDFIARLDKATQYTKGYQE